MCDVKKRLIREVVEGAREPQMDEVDEEFARWSKAKAWLPRRRFPPLLFPSKFRDAWRGGERERGREREREREKERERREREREC